MSNTHPESESEHDSREIPEGDEPPSLAENADELIDRLDRIEGVTESQSERLARVGGELSEFREMINSLQETVAVLDEQSTETARSADTARSSSVEAIEKIETAKQSATEAYDEVESLEAAIEDIEEMTTLINDIADQTNMLALNASIEAARVDSGGEGFAVVADEIKTLSEQVQSHANAIENAVTDAHDNTTATVEKIRAVESATADATESMDETITDLEGIDESAWETSEAIGDLSEKTTDHAEKTAEIASMVIDAIENAGDATDLVTATADVLDEHRELIGGLQVQDQP